VPVFRVDPRTAFGGYFLRLCGALARYIIRFVGATCRYRIVEGADRLNRLLGSPGPVLLVIWHDRAVLSACYFSGPFIRKRMDLALMISQSQDGEIVSHIVRPWKRVRSARGSATRGGRQALRIMYRIMAKEQIPGLLAPDGPHGPLREFKIGAAVLAQMANAPVLPVALAPQRCFRLKSWDRLIIPLPFSRVAVAFGQPIRVPRGVSATELEALRVRLQEELNRTTLRAEADAEPEIPVPATAHG